ncbi:MAG: alpha/beta-type small acid-soluble spore protein [Cellulosilyticaceae bacterium]
MKKIPALETMKQEVATELGVPLKQGYNGDITAKQAGSVGGEMVKRMIKAQEQQMSGHEK